MPDACHKMKIAYILPSFTIISGPSNGIRRQAEQWRKELTKRGHEIIKVNVWDDIDWASVDIVHFFYLGFSYVTIFQILKSKCPRAKFVCSPIIDSFFPTWIYNILSRIKIKKLKLWCELAVLRAYKNIFDHFIVRSDHEKKYLTAGLGVDHRKVKKIPLDFRINEHDLSYDKEDFCLHVSRINDPSKNVIRLVKAAIKFNFKLILVGASTVEFDNKLKGLIGNRKNIKILGRVTDEKLIDLYNRARVFALPSIREGVGLVALEAAVHGCDIVITSLGGPKEYFLPHAIAVNPFSTNAIGNAITQFLNRVSYQPALKNLIMKHNTPQQVIDNLENNYRTILESN